MKVAIVGSTLRSDWGGGEPRIARTVSDGLQTLGHDVVEHAWLRPTSALAAMVSSPMDWDGIALGHYIRVLKRENPDVVLGFYDYDTSLYRAARLLRIPCVASVHIYWPACPVGTLYIDGKGICDGPRFSKCIRHLADAIPPTRIRHGPRRLPGPLGAIALEKCLNRRRQFADIDYTIVPSSRMKELLEAFGFNRVVAIPNGLTGLNFPGLVRNRGRSKTVLFASGAPTERKGFPDFMELATIVNRQVPGTRFIATSFVGRGVVAGVGRLPHNEVIRLMAESHVVVAPVRWEEPFSVTVQEAMSVGTPVVAYSLGGMNEMIGDAGLLVPVGRVDLMAEAVVRILENDDLALDLANRSRARMSERFDPASMIQGYERTLQSAIERQDTVSLRAV